MAQAKTSTLAKTDDLELIRLVVPAGKRLPTHRAPGEIVVQCLEGRVEFVAGATTTELAAGQMLYLIAGSLHSLFRCLRIDRSYTMLLRTPSATSADWTACRKPRKNRFRPAIRRRILGHCAELK